MSVKPIKRNNKIFVLAILAGVIGLRFVESATPVPEYGRVFNGLGLESGKKGQWQKALTYYKKAIYFNPVLVDAYSNMAAAYRMNQNYDRAIEYARKATRSREIFRTPRETRVVSCWCERTLQNTVSRVAGKNNSHSSQSLPTS